MTSNIVAIIIILFLASLRVAHAEGGCPPGQYPQQGQGWQTCVPIPGGESGGAAQPLRPPVRWQEQWQAIATDTQSGVVGTSLDKASAEAAEQAAVSNCRAKGGSACTLQISYGNGCIAMVVGNKLLNTKGADTKSAAEQRALSQCNGEDTGCLVYYSACSLPQRIQ